MGVDQLWYLTAFLSHPLSGGDEHYEGCTLGSFILMDLKFCVLNVFWGQSLSFLSSFLLSFLFPFLSFSFPPSPPLPTSLNSINPTWNIVSPLYLYVSYPEIQPTMVQKYSEKSYIIADVLCRPTMIACCICTEHYRMFSCPYSLNNIV